MLETKMMLRVLALSAGVFAAACGGGGAVDVANRIVLDSVSVTPTVVSVQTGAVQPLVVTVFANGQALSGATVAFTAQNAAIADVDGSGVVRGVATGAAVIVVAATHSGATVSRNVAVNVTAAAPPPPGGGNTTATVTTSGNDFSPQAVTIIPGGSVTWQISGNTHNVTFGVNKPTGGDVPNTNSGGSATRVFPAAGTYPYQCTLHSNMAGSVLVQSGGGGNVPQTPAAVINVTATGFSPDDVRIAPGETVLWVFSGVSNNVIFDDIQPTGGNIPITQPGASVARTFPVAGDYDYRSTRGGDLKGRIRVR